MRFVIIFLMLFASCSAEKHKQLEPTSTKDSLSIAEVKRMFLISYSFWDSETNIPGFGQVLWTTPGNFPKHAFIEKHVKSQLPKKYKTTRIIVMSIYEFKTVEDYCYFNADIDSSDIINNKLSFCR